jgi:LPS-assembly lipoprotein
MPERSGYELRNTMIDLLGSDGRSGGKAYHLKMTLGEVAQDVAQQNDATITRYNDTLTVKYVLTDANGKVLTHGEKTSLSAYNVVTSPYSTLVAQQDADKRAAEDIAQRIRIDLGIYFDQVAHK